jgi:hypothetical protein
LECDDTNNFYWLTVSQKKPLSSSCSPIFHACSEILVLRLISL